MTERHHVGVAPDVVHLFRLQPEPVADNLLEHGLMALALGDRAGIRRFGDAMVPMDESLATAAIDAGGRRHLCRTVEVERATFDFSQYHSNGTAGLLVNPHRSGKFAATVLHPLVAGEAKELD